MARPIPDLPEYDDSDAIPLTRAADLVLGERGEPPHHSLLQRWATQGRRFTPGGEKYLFPTVKTSRLRLTTPAWCAAWNRFAARLRSETARLQLEAAVKASRA